MRFIEMSGQATALTDLECRILLVNSPMCRLLGEDSPSDLEQKELNAYHSLESREQLRDRIIPQVWQEGRWTGELTMVDKHGHDTLVTETIFLLRSKKDEPLSFATIVTATQEHQCSQQEALVNPIHSEKVDTHHTTEIEKNTVQFRHLQSILESTSDLVATAYQNGEVFYMNAAGRRMLGLSADEDLNHLCMEDAHPVWVRPILNDGLTPIFKPRTVHS